MTAICIQAHPDELLTPKEVAQLLKVCTRTVYRMIGDKKIKHIRVGPQIRIHRADLDGFLDRD